MKIDRIYVDTCPRDIRQTYINLTSIRFWYPDIPITVLLDPQYKDFLAPELARVWGCEICIPDKRFGQQWGKFHALFAPAGSRIMYVDSDIVFLGPVIDRLEQYSEDIIVVDEYHPIENIENYFFGVDQLRALDPDFMITHQCFNNGQFVVTTGLVKEEDFKSVVDIREGQMVAKYDYFRCCDQGVMNYVVQKMEQQNRLSVRRDAYMLWGGGDHSGIDASALGRNSRYDQLLHWTGTSIETSTVPNKHILKYFEDLFVEYLAGNLS